MSSQNPKPKTVELGPEASVPPPPAAAEEPVSAVPFFAVWLRGWDQAMASIDAATPEAGPVSEAAKTGAPVFEADGIAVVGIRGPLLKNDGWFVRFVEGTSYRGISLGVKAALADPKVEEVLLHVDSPGGSVDGLDEVATIIRSARERKPVTAMIDGLGASAAYWLASQATRVVATPTALVGSIGVITHITDTSKLFAKAGIKTHVVTTGEHKATGLDGVEVTDEMLAEVRKIVEFYGDAFKAAVVAGRHLPAEQVDELATGAMWPAPDAVANNLIDSTGTIEDTVAAIIVKVAEARKARNRRRARGRDRRHRQAQLLDFSRNT